MPDAVFALETKQVVTRRTQDPPEPTRTALSVFPSSSPAEGLLSGTWLSVDSHSPLSFHPLLFPAGVEH